MNIKTTWFNWPAVASSTSTLIYEATYSLNPAKINYIAVLIAADIPWRTEKICNLLKKQFPYLQYNENQPASRTFAQLTIKSIVSISLGLTYGAITGMIIPSLGITVAYGGGLGAISLVSPYLLSIIKKIAITIKDFFSFMITPKNVTLDIDPETFKFEDKIWASLGFKMTNPQELKLEREKVTNKFKETEKLNWHWNYMSIIANQIRVSLAKGTPYQDSLFKKVGLIMDMVLSKKIFLVTHLLAKELTVMNSTKYLSDEFIGKLSWHVVNAVIVKHAGDNDNKNIKNIDGFSSDIEELFYKKHPNINRSEMGSSEHEFINNICEKVNNRLEDYSIEEKKQKENHKISSVNGDSPKTN